MIAPATPTGSFFDGNGEHPIGSIDHVWQYVGPWGILEERLQAMVDRLSRLDFTAHVANYRASMPVMSPPSERISILEGGVAVVDISGPLLKYGSSLGGTASITTRRQIRHAMQSEAVKSILLRIDSPGGSIAGVYDLAADVAAAAARKPTVAHISDLGSGTAYWIASQAGKVYANSTAIVGSIGVHMVVTDASQMAANQGVKVHVVKAGAFKGSGEVGTEITTEQLARWQRDINTFGGFFTEAVARGRKLPMARAKELSDGAVYVGQKAVDVGLIDGIESLDATLARLRASSIPQPGKQAAAKITATNQPPVVSTVRPATPPAPKEPEMSATKTWNAEVHKRMTAGQSRADAIADLSRSNPQLREKYLDEYNAAARAEENKRFGR